MSITTENTFETAIVQALVEKGGYSLGDSATYSPVLGFFKEEILAFLQRSQPRRWAKISAIHGADTPNRLLQRLYKELDLRGCLDVLRNGFVDYGVRFQMAFFKPVSGLNPDAVALYNTNSLKVYRQIYYSKKNKKSVDLVLGLNGLPVATLELKNQFTGQNVKHAQKQYKDTRDSKELLFAFKKRTLVHFSVDSDDVYMATRLEGSDTYWLPFNKGHEHGKGNPIDQTGDYRSAYLWKHILTKDSCLEILQRFVHLQVEEVISSGKVYKKEKMIFPRYHQLDAVRAITNDVLIHGAGKNYLVQHSAGSGKSNSIAWLAYSLMSLHNAADNRVFDSVIVVTDRRVLDQQLQDTIYQIEHKQGVVQKIDKNSSQLADAITNGTNIIITTLQKFPYVVDKIGALPNRKYAVIIDEAHSSQGGEASKKMKEVLGAEETDRVEEPFPKYGEGSDDNTVLGQDLINSCIQKSAQARGQQNNVSFFAFTATPKYKTLQIFGCKDKEGKPKPFHLYAMRQAIEEGFILDVLKNYTTYELYYKLTKAIESDPKLNKKKTAQAIGKYLSLHPHNLAQKTEIIMEHFRTIVAKKIGGLAKAMLVCGSRLHAKRYFEAFNKYIKEKGYHNELKIIVAFSGKLRDSEDPSKPEGVLESELNGFREKELPQMFDKEEYKILIVADKYQTGFDQPLLHTMYVDKKLSGVRAVQTLSRLNRRCKGKDDTFVLDFANDRATIFKSFQPYYEVTTVTDETDVNHLYDLKARLDTFKLYWQEEIDALANVYFDPNTNLNQAKNQRYLYSFTDPAVERFRQLDEVEKQDEFKKSIRSWTNLYAFLAQIMPFTDTELEKFYAYAKLLQTRLPKKDLSEVFQLSDEVALEYYRLEKIKEGSIELLKGAEGELSGTTEAGLKRTKEEEVLLSEIVSILNDRFGTTFEEADKLIFDQVEADLLADEKLKIQARANPLDTFKYVFEEPFMQTLIGRMEQNQAIFEKIFSDKLFGKLVMELMMKKVYRQLNE